MSLIWFLLIIGVSIFVHELGHYLAARVQGVGVKTFAIGFGPRLLGFRAWNTDWRLNLLPLGGYAAIDGMEPGDTHGYNALRWPGKVLILLGGVIFNLLLAWGVLGGLAATQGLPNPTPEAKISQVVAGSAAEKLGLKAGDVVTALDGVPFTIFSDVGKFKERQGDHTFTVQRKGQTVELPFVWNGGPNDKLGFSYGPRDYTFTKISFFQGFGRAAVGTFQAVPMIISSIGKGIGGLLAGNKDSDLTGLVGIAAETNRASQAGASRLVELLANINLSLAIFNLLPIPVLDGGRIFFIFLGGLLGLFGRRLRPEQEMNASYVGMMLLLLLFVLVTINDIRRLAGG
jgi:regulator of sigma E protease